MTKDQREEFLADVHVGVITVAREVGAPMAGPVWYHYEPGGDVVFVVEPTSEKVRLLERSGEASLCAQSEVVPYKYVTVEGPTVVGDVDDDMERLLAYRYLGREVGDVYLQAVAGSEGRVVRLTPTRWRTVDYTRFMDRVLAATE